ncbi:hypothetical protein [Brevibacillus sp. BC25]
MWCDALQFPRKRTGYAKHWLFMFI